MSDQHSTPGVSRDNRISAEGLQRLDRQLARGGRIAAPVLRQWINRYGDAARDVIKKHGCYTAELDQV